MIAIIDYGMGNLRSVQKACEYVGCEAVITAQAREIERASHVILPGVGAAEAAVHSLRASGLWEVARAQALAGKPFLGICLGMQLLFDESLENGRHPGLGLIPGCVTPFDAGVLRVPHIGWNSLEVTRPNALIPEEGGYVYFVHSYFAAQVPEEFVTARSDYGGAFVAAVQRGNLFGLQFHPEKSGETGLAMIKKFGGYTA